MNVVGFEWSVMSAGSVMNRSVLNRHRLIFRPIGIKEPFNFLCREAKLRGR